MQTSAMKRETGNVMMDEIIGIAILDNSVRPRRLGILCQCADGCQFIDSIPVYDHREPPPCDPCWAIYIPASPEGCAPHSILHAQPSVHSRYQLPPDGTWHTRFHNGGQWRVRFQYAVPPHSLEQQVREANGLTEDFGSGKWRPL
jgi:hypothetical protein